MISGMSQIRFAISQVVVPASRNTESPGCTNSAHFPAIAALLFCCWSAFSHKPLPALQPHLHGIVRSYCCFPALPDLFGSSWSLHLVLWPVRLPAHFRSLISSTIMACLSAASISFPPTLCRICYLQSFYSSTL